MNELSWKNAEGLRIHAVRWAVAQPRAVLLLIHGQGEHIGRYEHLGQWYNAKGIAVVGYDQQGYGRSEGRRGHAKNLDVLLNDVGQALEETRRLYPGVPLFLYGHSMGGNIVLNFLFRRRPAVTGVIATGPWVRLAFQAPTLKVLAGQLLRHIIPNLRLPNGLAVHFLSHDPEVVAAYQRDPHVHNLLSAGAGIALLEGANWLDRYSGDTPAPLLLMHGAADKITSAPATRELAARLGGNVTHREWPDLYHEIHNEPEKEVVFAYTFDWIQKRLAI